jgi:hypothetical protein
MSARRTLNRLYYFTTEDESILAESFPRIEETVYAVTYKVKGTDDVFVTTAETREAMERHDIAHNVLAEEDSARIALYHSPLSKEELNDFEDALKALTLANRAIAMACVGVNGEGNLGFDLSEGTHQFTYFTAPAGHTFIWRLFTSRDEAFNFMAKLTMNDKRALEWVEAIPLDNSADLKGYH